MRRSSSGIRGVGAAAVLVDPVAGRVGRAGPDRRIAVVAVRRNLHAVAVDVEVRRWWWRRRGRRERERGAVEQDRDAAVGVVRHRDVGPGVGIHVGDGHAARAGVGRHRRARVLNEAAAAVRSSTEAVLAAWLPVTTSGRPSELKSPLAIPTGPSPTENGRAGRLREPSRGFPQEQPDLVLAVVRDREVRPAVAVEVACEDTLRRGPDRDRRARLLRERRAVAEQDGDRARAGVGDREVGPAGAVEVRRGDGARVRPGRRGSGHEGESAGGPAEDPAHRCRCSWSPRCR